MNKIKERTGEYKRLIRKYAEDEIGVWLQNGNPSFTSIYIETMIFHAQNEIKLFTSMNNAAFDNENVLSNLKIFLQNQKSETRCGKPLQVILEIGDADLLGRLYENRLYREVLSNPLYRDQVQCDLVSTRMEEEDEYDKLSTHSLKNKKNNLRVEFKIRKYFMIVDHNIFWDQQKYLNTNLGTKSSFCCFNDKSYTKFLHKRFSGIKDIVDELKVEK